MVHIEWFITNTMIYFGLFITNAMVDFWVVYPECKG